MNRVIDMKANAAKYSCNCVVKSVNMITYIDNNNADMIVTVYLFRTWFSYNIVNIPIAAMIMNNGVLQLPIFSLILIWVAV
jgi:hypothetical protein